MNTRCRSYAVLALVVLASLIAGGWRSGSTEPHVLLADAPASEHYRLAASEVGDVPAVMESAAYALNEGVALRAEANSPMGSERYRVGGGRAAYRVQLPLVLKGRR